MFIKLKNLKIHYKITGNGDPIILLHGWGASINYFIKLRTHLAQRFTVYAIDLPGFGLSDAPNGTWGSAEYAGLIAQFIHDLKIFNPVLLGHSFGGKIAINLGACGLVAAKKMVLISSAGILLPKPFKTKLKIYFFKLIKRVLQLPLIKNLFKHRWELLGKKFGSNDYRNAHGVMRKILVKTVNENIITLLPKIRIPTLLIWGDQDVETPLQAGKIMAQAIEGAELKIISGSGHFSFIDNWKKVVEELDNFLS